MTLETHGKSLRAEEGQFSFHFCSSKKSGASGSIAEEEKDEDKDEHDEEKLKKSREWDEWKDSKPSISFCLSSWKVNG